MEASLLIRLIDQVTGPAEKVGRALRKVGDVVGELKRGFSDAIRQGFSVDNIEQASRNAEAALSRARSRLLGAVGTTMALAAPVRMAGQFDQAMKGLDKVLDVPVKRLAALRKFALDTSALIPIAAKSVVELMAAAAQGGVPQVELEAFARYVANAAVAFDMAGEEIGDRFAKLRNVYKLTQEGIEDLGDATNFLSNNMAARASEVTDFTNRAAGAAAIFHLTATQTAAAGAAMIAAGIVPETAARGFTAMATRVLSGGKEIDAAFKSIGTSRKQFLADLEADGPAALQRLFATMAASPNGMQALIDIVGRDFADDFAKLLGNPELLEQAFQMVADKSAYAGSAVDEAAKQAAGAEKRWDLLVNKLSRAAIVVGDQLLPPLLKAADALGDLVDRMSDFAQANPELAAGIVQAVGALLALSVAARVGAWVFAGLRVGLLSALRLFLAFNREGRNVAAGWRAISLAGTFLRAFLAGAAAELTGVGAAIAGITAPVWALIAALIVAGFALWKYWDRISAFVAGFASVFAELLAPVGELADGVGRLAADLADIAGIDLGAVGAGLSAMFDAFRRLGDITIWISDAKAALSGLGGWLSGIFSQEKLSDADRAAIYENGRAMAQALIDGIREHLAKLIQPVRDLFNFTMSIDWPEPPAWLSWLIEKGGGAVDAIGAKVSGNSGQSPSVAADAGGGGIGSWLGGAWDRLTGTAQEMQRGGEAVAGGGADAGAALKEGAAAIRDAAGQLRGAAAAAAAAGRSGGAGAIAGAAASARTGALHGGPQ
jgi:TP901 family phage tail tape measure protein